MHGISNSSATFSPNLASLWPLIHEIPSKVHESSKNSKIYSLDWLHYISFAVRCANLHSLHVACMAREELVAMGSCTTYSRHALQAGLALYNNNYVDR